MMMGGRSWQQNQDYRFGFNGKETDPETDLQDYGFRIYNPAIAKFLSVDPLAPDYPELTPYQFASNRPIDGVDLDGLEYLDSDEAKIEAHFGALRLKVSNLNSVSRGARRRANLDPAKNWDNRGNGQIGMSTVIATFSYKTLHLPERQMVRDANAGKGVKVPEPKVLSTDRLIKDGSRMKKTTREYKDFVHAQNKAEEINSRGGIPTFNPTTSRQTRTTARGMIAVEALNTGLELLLRYMAGSDRNAVNEQLSVVRYAIKDLNTASRNGMLGDYNNPQDMAAILNVVLQGELTSGVADLPHSAQLLKIGLQISRDISQNISSENAKKLEEMESDGSVQLEVTDAPLKFRGN